ncbi:hypothetical protein M885DRAFT_570623 [Pelagophyceae sp. CCMP2097]|nr:hypothetical protein M885DRAFT_570623 [Pelagophyceae sp. CCMP2097]
MSRASPSGVCASGPVAVTAVTTAQHIVRVGALVEPRRRYGSAAERRLLDHQVEILVRGYRQYAARQQAYVFRQGPYVQRPNGRHC